MAEGNTLTENQEALMEQSRQAQKLLDEGKANNNPDQILAGQNLLGAMADPARVQAKYDKARAPIIPSMNTEIPKQGLFSKLKNLLRRNQTPPATKAA